MIEQILGAAPGIEKHKDAYALADEHLASIYLGAHGPTTALTEIVRVTMRDAWLEAEAKDRTLHFVAYENVFALSLRRPRDPEKARTGF